MLIGIDGGGTKTDICLARADGSIAARRRLKGINASTLGVEVAFGRLMMQIAGIMGASRVRALYAGIAGAGSPAVQATLAGMIRAAFPAIAAVEVQSDAFNALNGEIGLSDGIAMISGTGSSAFARKGGAVTQVGGWGYLVDDAGSGYALGRACLAAAYRALDGRGEKTAMLELCEKKLGMPLRDAIPSLYEGGAARVASFAPVAFRAARAGDAVAARLVDACAKDAAEHIAVCRAQMDGRGATCVLSGGMFREEAFYQKVRALAGAPGFEVKRAVLAPVYGALVAAAALAGLEAGAEFRASFQKTLVAPEDRA